MALRSTDGVNHVLQGRNFVLQEDIVASCGHDPAHCEVSVVFDDLIEWTREASRGFLQKRLS
jgi:hypothetical protein